MNERRLRDDALAIWKAGVEAVEAGRLVRESLRRHEGLLLADVGAGSDAIWSTDLAAVRHVAVVGAGKATTAMARAVEDVLGPRLLAAKRVTGWVNVPDATVEELRRIHVHGARSLPDNRPTAEGVKGSKEILAIARSMDEQDLLIVLVSGGGSALLPLPVDGVTLEDKLAVTTLLQERGATIGEMNCVRKHLSQIKAGRLAQATKARVLTLVVSDVVDDPLDVIASGPTAPDPTTFEQALAAVDAHGLRDALPPAALAHLEAGVRGEIPETPKELDAVRVRTLVVGSNWTALHAARVAAHALGYGSNFGGVLVGDTQEAARRFASWLHPRDYRICIVSGGETTVTLPREHGKGGRNQEFALTMLVELGLDRLGGICILCGGTDGEDGPTDAAGAVVDEELARAAIATGLDPADFLRRHDAYNFFDPLDGLVRTGPTNTNVMDLRVVLIDRTESAAVPALATPKRRSVSDSVGH